LGFKFDVFGEIGCLLWDDKERQKRKTTNGLPITVTATLLQRLAPEWPNAKIQNGFFKDFTSTSKKLGSRKAVLLSWKGPMSQGAYVLARSQNNNRNNFSLPRLLFRHSGSGL
jgi:hypothetical protein